MQPDQAGGVGIGTRRSPFGEDRPAVESRRRALDRLRGAFQAGLCGPVLITGEPGAGKSWLTARFAEGLPAGWRSAEVEVTSALDGLELLRLAGDAIGLELPDRPGAARLRLAAGLREADADGRSWLLVLDEVQRATAGAWEEIQAQANQLGRPGGFAAMILLARTELARDLSTPRRAGWASRLGLHIHLPPLDLDEARMLLRADSRLSESELESLHRDAMGNPRAMLRLLAASGQAARIAADPPAIARRPAANRPARPLPGPARRPSDDSIADDGAIPALEDEQPPPRLPSLIPSRPPIRMEEGLVEVGWEGDLEAEPTRPEGSATVEGDEAGPGEEPVEDRYAALQAWAEWSRNRERSSAGAEPATAPVATDDAEEPVPEPAVATAGDPISAASTVRAEPPQDFAPYSQLFGRSRHAL